MRTVYGKIRTVDIQNRLFALLVKNQIEYFYLSRSQLKRFKSYLYGGLYVEFNCSEHRIKRDYVMAYEVINFVKMIRPLKNKRLVYYDVDTIKDGVKKLINKDTYRLFIDFEFTMPPYNYTSGNGFRAEIIQYGFCLEDNDGQVVTTACGMLKPRNLEGINSRTAEFLHIGRNELKKAKNFTYFYKVLKDILSLYQPVVFVWGKNDIMMLDKAYEQYHLEPLLERKQIINIMQVIKNYYSIKTDIGLYNAYQLFKQKAPMEQDHNALNDAIATSEIFKLFQKELG